MWLTLGVFVWSIVHLLQFLTPDIRINLINRIGENPYKGLFSLLIVISVVLMVFGWRNSSPELVYLPPIYGHMVTLILSAVALILFFSSKVATNIKRLLRHPQLTGFTLWAVAHLFSNGDSRSIILFGGLALWAILEVLFINRRDGDWVKPAAVPLARDLIPILIGLTVYILLLWLHPYFAGVAVTPG